MAEMESKLSKDSFSFEALSDSSAGYFCFHELLDLAHVLS